jgi:formylglycine-generating enzyme required for sulfatase activity
MRRFLQYSLPLCFLVSAVSWILFPPSASRAPAKPAQPAEHKPYTETIPGSKVTFDMVSIPGGKFLMGSPAKEAGRGDDEGPQHAVSVGPFWMGKLEVTWNEYDLFWKTKKGAKGEKPNTGNKVADAVSRPTPPYADETFGHGRENHPVLCITHHAAMEYCRWLSAVTGKTYRLPTEAEWEYACRAGTTTAYSFGDDPKKLGDYAWYAENAEDLTHEVGKKKPNPWGLYDMHGNVSEWCLDHYQKDYYSTFKKDTTALAPVLLPTANRFSHVARGGSWADGAELLRSAARRGSNKDWIQRDPQRPQSIWWLTDADFVGFRIVRPVKEQENLKNPRSKVTRESK